MSMEFRELAPEVTKDVERQAREMVSELMQRLFTAPPTPAQADINFMVLRRVAARLLASQLATGIANIPETAQSKEAGVKFFSEFMNFVICEVWEETMHFLNCPASSTKFPLAKKGDQL